MSSRPVEAAANLYSHRNKALLAVPAGIAAAYLIGIPTSFVRRRGSLPWVPMDMVVMGTIWALVISIFTVLVLVIMQRYVALYQTGSSVAGQIVSEHLRGGIRGVVVAFADVSQQPKYSWVAPSQLRVGTPTSVIVGPAGSRLVLVDTRDGSYARGSALNQQQIAQIISG